MEKKRYLSITLAMCLVFSILSGCGGQAAQSPQTQAAGDAKEESRQDGTAGESPEDTANQASGDTILIGVSGSITGAAPINGLRTKQGAQMAADEINAAGGVLGRQIELFVADDGGAQDTAINAANLIISQDVAARGRAKPVRYGAGSGRPAVTGQGSHAHRRHQPQAGYHH